MKNKAVLVTTEFRGVFFGYVKEDKHLPDEITITQDGYGYGDGSDVTSKILALDK